MQELSLIDIFEIVAKEHANRVLSKRVGTYTDDMLKRLINRKTTEYMNKLVSDYKKDKEEMGLGTVWYFHFLNPFTKVKLPGKILLLINIDCITFEMHTEYAESIEEKVISLTQSKREKCYVIKNGINIDFTVENVDKGLQVTYDYTEIKKVLKGKIKLLQSQIDTIQQQIEAMS